MEDFGAFLYGLLQKAECLDVMEADWVIQQKSIYKISDLGDVVVGMSEWPVLVVHTL